MQVVISKNLLHGLERLSKEDRKRTVAMLDKLQEETTSAGIRWHPVMNGFVSLSPTMSVRVIAQSVGEKVVLHHVDHHDDAYKWAEKHRPMTDVASGTFELLTIPESIVEGNAAEALLQAFGIALTERLTKDGIPDYVANGFRLCQTEDDILTCLELMSPEWQEAVWASVTQKNSASKPAGSSAVRVIRDDQRLSKALEYTIGDWRTFLHPRQLEAVTDQVHRNLLIIGGPGTGKTVACAHRAVFLSRSISDEEVVVVFTYSINLVKDLQNLITDLLPNQVRPDRKIWVLPCQNVSTQDDPRTPVLICANEVALMAKGQQKRVKAIIVDEGQDSPDYFLDFLHRAQEKADCDSFTTALDMNQAIFRINHAQNLKRIVGNAHVFNLSYCYRMTKPLLENAFSVLSQYAAEYSYALDFSSGLQLPIAVITGPRIAYIKSQSLATQISSARETIQALERKYTSNESLVLIHVQYWNPHFAKSGKVDPIAEALKNDEVLGKYYRFAASTKGKEYFAGVLFCPDDFMTHDNGPGNVMRLNTLFVSMTRIRDEMTVIYRANSPTERYLPVGS